MNGTELAPRTTQGNAWIRPGVVQAARAAIPYARRRSGGEILRILAASAGRAMARLFIPSYSPAPSRARFDGLEDAGRRQLPMAPITRTEWFQQDITTALIMADNGDLSLAGQLCRALRRDGVLSGLLSARVGGLVGLAKQFRGDPDVVAWWQGDGEDEGEFDRVFSSVELTLLAGDGVLLGVAIGEIIEDDFGCKHFVRLDPEHLRYRKEEDRWYYQTAAGLTLVTPGDGRWILHMPGGYLNPWQQGLFAALARAYISKDHALNYRDSYNSKLANPARAAYSPSGSTEREREGFLENVIAWGVNTVFEMPPGWDVRIIESNGVGFQVFQDTADDADKEYSICISGQEPTTTGGQAFSNMDVHERVRGDIIKTDGVGLSKTMTTQGIRPLTLEQWGPARCRVTWDTKKPQDLTAFATSVTGMGTSLDTANKALAPEGLKLDAADYVKRFGVVVKRIDTDVDSAAAANAPPIYGYDLDAGVASKNERREQLRLPETGNPEDDIAKPLGASASEAA